MLLWVGLGNPEPNMARQRHNIGFMAVDVIALRHGFSPWRQRFKGLVAEGNVGGVRVIGLKPLTYMNESGDSVQAASAFYKLPVEAITAFHDELDLNPGRVKVKRGGGAAGHNGLRSMDRMLGSQDYWRVRLGIGHPGVKSEVVNYVLQRPAPEQREAIEHSIQQGLSALDLLLDGDMERAMMKVHARPSRPHTPKPAPKSETKSEIQLAPNPPPAGAGGTSAPPEDADRQPTGPGDPDPEGSGA